MMNFSPILQAWNQSSMLVTFMDCCWQTDQIYHQYRSNLSPIDVALIVDDFIKVPKWNKVVSIGSLDLNNVVNYEKKPISTSTLTPPPTTKRTTLARARSGELKPVERCGSLCSKYFVTVQTSSDWFSGTDNSVFIKLRFMVFKKFQ